jgi:hypothetical protein
MAKKKEKPVKEEKPAEKVKPVETAEEQPEKEEMTEDEALKKLQDTVNRMPVKDLIGSMMMNLAATSYVKLGLPAETNAGYKDVAQAKQAIDCLDTLVKAIEPALEPQEVDAYRQTVANLKLAYAQAV